MSIDAMKQALEVLKGIHEGNMTPIAGKYWNKAITSLRQAITEEENEKVIKAGGRPVTWAEIFNKTNNV